MVIKHVLMAQDRIDWTWVVVATTTYRAWSSWESFSYCFLYSCSVVVVKKTQVGCEEKQSSLFIYCPNRVGLSRWTNDGRRTMFNHLLLLSPVAIELIRTRTAESRSRRNSEYVTPEERFPHHHPLLVALVWFN